MKVDMSESVITLVKLVQEHIIPQLKSIADKLETVLIEHERQKSKLENIGDRITYLEEKCRGVVERIRPLEDRARDGCRQDKECNEKNKIVAQLAPKVNRFEEYILENSQQHKEYAGANQFIEQLKVRIARNEEKNSEQELRFQKTVGRLWTLAIGLLIALAGAYAQLHFK